MIKLANPEPLSHLLFIIGLPVISARIVRP